jgi:DNA-binding Lrp family transcriptional regulator
MENKTKNYRLKFVKYFKREHVEYVIRLICIEDDKINVEFLERYSTLKDLHEILRKEANSINFPKFPPKKYFGNTDEKFLNQRQTALEHYFNTILGSKEFSTVYSLKKWIESLIIKYNKTSTNSPVQKAPEDRPSVLNVPRPSTLDNITSQPTAPKNGKFILISARYSKMEGNS